MAETISIIMKVNDGISGTLKTIENCSRGLSKELEIMARKVQDLSKRQDSYNKKYAEYAVQVAEAKKRMDDLRKEVSKTGDEFSKLKLEYATEEWKSLTDAMNIAKQAASDTAKEINSIHADMKKKTDSSGGIFGSGLGAGLAKSGVLRDFGNSITAFSGTVIESEIGRPVATLLSETLSGTVSGAAAGAIAGIPGMIAGGAFGMVAGGINAANKVFGEQDESFKDYYRGLYEDTNTATAERLSSGSTLAAGRETTKLSFNTLLGGEEQSGAFLKDVLDTANTTPFLYDDLVGISKTMLSFGTAVDDIIPTLTKVGDAGAALGLSTGDIGTVATYLGRMQSSDKATLEYLNPLNERGFSVFQWLADDQGVSVGDVYSQISKGELSGSYVSDVILTQFEKLYAGMMEIQSKSTEGLDSTLQGLKENVDAAGGDAYNEARKESKEADIAAYGGALGDKLAELSAIGGEVQAYGENLRDQFQREALEAVLTGTLDKEATAFSEEDAAKLEALSQKFSEANQAYENGSLEAGQKMVDLREEAEALATAAYESSEWAQKQVDMQVEQIDATRELTKAMVSATDAWRTNNAFSKGGAAGAAFTFTTAVDERTGAVSYVDKYGQTVDPMLVDAGGASGWAGKGRNRPGQYAVGLDYVPYDEFPALLHQGERVLTAAEARSADRGGGSVSVTVTGNQFHVREDSDVDAVAEALAEKLQAAVLRGGG